MRADCCPHCRGDLAAAVQAPCESYDHIEIPPIRPEVTRVTLMGGTCPHCAKAFKGHAACGHAAWLAVRGELPDAGAAPALQPRHIGLARLEGLFRDVFRVAISQGGLVNIIRAAAAPFAAQAARLRERPLQSPVLASDETWLRVAGSSSPPTTAPSALRLCATFREVTGGFRTFEGAACYADARSLLETARRRNLPPLRAIALTLQGTRCRSSPLERG